MSKAEEMIEVYGIGEICLPSEQARADPPSAHAHRGEGHETGGGEGGLRKAWRCFNISVSYSVCPVWGYGNMDRKPRLLAQKLGRMSAR